MSRKTFLCIQRSNPERQAQCEAPSPAQMEQMFAKFNAWREKFQESIVDMGGRLGGEGKVVTAEGATDGPFVESKEIVGGYMIVSAETIEEAAQIALESPGVMGPGASVEVREIKTS
ncbi:MAG: hypothetical protein KDB14_11620 [Planctomycetales bacterium]|nr:hypothetical protein [Planctomycetales bacterium]